jgi:hypothetical protein
MNILGLSSTINVFALQLVLWLNLSGIPEMYLASLAKLFEINT